MAETVQQVIIYQASGLQVGIDDGGSQELESPLLHVFGYAIGQGCGGGDLLEAFKPVHYLLPLCKSPEVITKVPKFLPDFQEATCVIYG